MAVQPYILVIDDDIRAFDLLEATFDAIQIPAVFVTSTQEAFEQLQHSIPVMILMDLLLPAPSMKGWEAIQVLKNEPSTAGIPILAFTAAGGEGINRAMRAGADGFIEKPFSVVQMQRMVLKYVGAAQR